MDVPNEEAKALILAHLPNDWHLTKGLGYVYFLTAPAEAGLRKDDLKNEWLAQARARVLRKSCGCEDFMLLRALVMLDCEDGDFVREAISDASKAALPDGGFLCKMKLEKKTHTPKGCYRANMMALLCASERRHGGEQDG